MVTGASFYTPVLKKYGLYYNSNTSTGKVQYSSGLSLRGVRSHVHASAHAKRTRGVRLATRLEYNKFSIFLFIYKSILKTNERDKCYKNGSFYSPSQPEDTNSRHVSVYVVRQPIRFKPSVYTMPVEFENGTKSCQYVNTSKKVLHLHDAVRIY